MLQLHWIDLFSNAGLSSAVATGASAVGAIEVVLPPAGGHGSDHETELNGKRVMTNIRLTYSEGQGDFPVDNDFRRIGIVADPYNYGTTTFYYFLWTATLEDCSCCSPLSRAAIMVL